MKVQHIIIILSDGRKGLFTGKPFATQGDTEAGVDVVDVRFTKTMEMKSGSIPVDVDEILNSEKEEA